MLPGCSERIALDARTTSWQATRSSGSRSTLRLALIAGIVAACLLAGFAFDRALTQGGARSRARGAFGAASWRQGRSALSQRLSASGLSMATGTVQSVSAGTIDLQTLRGAAETVTLSATTVYRERGTPSASLADVVTGCRVVVIGKRAGGGGLTAGRVLILPAGAGTGFPG